MLNVSLGVGGFLARGIAPVARQLQCSPWHDEMIRGEAYKAFIHEATSESFARIAEIIRDFWEVHPPPPQKKSGSYYSNMIALGS